MADDFAPVIPSEFQQADRMKQADDLYKQIGSPVQQFVQSYTDKVINPFYDQARQSAMDFLSKQSAQPQPSTDQSASAPTDQSASTPTDQSANTPTYMSTMQSSDTGGDQTQSPQSQPQPQSQDQQPGILQQAGQAATDLGQRAVSAVQSVVDTKDYSRQALEAYARARAQAYGVDPDIFVRQINQESGFNPSAHNPSGASGIGQFMPETAQGMGINPYDPYASLDAAAKLDAEHLKNYNGDYRMMLAAYNAGAGNLQKYGLAGVMSPDFAQGQTLRYVNNIMGNSAPVASQQEYSASGQPISDTLTQQLLQPSPQQTDISKFSQSYNPTAAHIADQEATNQNLTDVNNALQQAAIQSGVYLPPIPQSGQSPDLRSEMQKMIDAELHRTRTPFGPGGFGLYNPNLIPQVGNDANQAFESGMHALEEGLGPVAGNIGKVIVSTGGINDKGLPNNPLGVAGEAINVINPGIGHLPTEVAQDETGAPITQEQLRNQVVQDRLQQAQNMYNEVRAKFGLPTEEGQQGSLFGEPTSNGKPEGSGTSGPAMAAGGNGSGEPPPTASAAPTPEEQPTPGRIQQVTGAATTARASTDPRRQFDLQYAVVPLDQLQTSHTQGFQENPAYPTALQPRNRESTASQQQVNAIANQFEPSALTEDTKRTDTGTPIVNDQGQVVAGNGRTMALRQVKDQHPDAWQAYQQQVAQVAPSLGIDPQQLQGIKDPVLVRMTKAPFNEQAFLAEDSNTSSTLRMSASELARQDAKLIDNNQLANVAIGETQSLTDALKNKANLDFVRSFVGALPPTERSTMMDAQGYLSNTGVQRIRNAIFAKAFDGPEGRVLAQAFTDSTQDSVKRIESAVVSNIGPLAQAKSLIESGQRDPSLDASEDIATAINRVTQLKRANIKVSDYLAQPELIQSGITPLQRDLMANIDKMSSNTAKLRTFLGEYAKGIEDAPDPNQGSLFGPVEQPTKDQILAKSIVAAEQSGNRTDNRENMSELSARTLQEAQGTPEQQAQVQQRLEDQPQQEKQVLLHLYPREVEPYVEQAFMDNGLFAGRRGGVVSDPVAAQKAVEAAAGKSVEEFLRSKQGTAFNQTDILTMGNGLVNMSKTIDGLARQVRDLKIAGQDTSKLELELGDKLLTFQALASVFRGSQAESGRALRSYRMAMNGEYGLRMRASAKAAKAFGVGNGNGNGNGNGTGNGRLESPYLGDLNGHAPPPNGITKPKFSNGKVVDAVVAKPSFTPEQIDKLAPFDRDLINKAQSMYANLGIDSILAKASGKVPGAESTLTPDEQKNLTLWNNFWQENQTRLLDIGANVSSERFAPGEHGAGLYETKPSEQASQFAMPGMREATGVEGTGNGETPAWKIVSVGNEGTTSQGTFLAGDQPPTPGEGDPNNIVQAWKWLHINADGVISQGSFIPDRSTYTMKLAYTPEDLAAAKAGEQLPLLKGNFQAGGEAVQKTADRAFAAIGQNRQQFDDWMQAWLRTDDTDYTQRYRLLSMLTKPGMMRYALSLNMSDILSSNRTWEIVGMHGFIQAFNDPLIRALRGHPDEAQVQAVGMANSVGLAWSNAMTALTTGIHPSEAQGIIQGGDLDHIRAESFQGTKGLVLMPALRVIGAIHEAARTMAAAGAEQLWAYQQSKKTGRPMQEYLDSPPKEMLDFAQQMADKASSGGEPSAPGRAVLGVRNLAYWQAPKGKEYLKPTEGPVRAFGYVMHVLFPFVRIPDFIYRNGLKILTGPAYYPAMAAYHGARIGLSQTGLARPLGLEGLDAGYDKERIGGDLALAVVSGMLDYYIYQQAMAGNITGGGPQSPEQRAQLEAATDPKTGAQVWQAHSFRVGNRWVDYSTLGGPLAVPMAAIASYAEAVRSEGNKSSFQNPDPFAKGAVGMAQALSDASYMKTLGDLVKAIQQGSGAKGAAESLAANFIERWIPGEGLLNQAAQATDSGIKAPRNIPEEVMSRLPGLSHQVPNRVDVYGRAVTQPRDLVTMFSPGRTTGYAQPDAVSAEVARLQQSGNPISVRYFSGQKAGQQYQGAYQTPDQTRGLQQDYGQAAHTYITGVMNNPQYAGLSDQQKSAALNSAVAASEKAAAVPAASIATRDPAHQAADAWASVPKYFGVSGTPDQIREQNLKISMAKAELDQYKKQYGQYLGPVKMRQADPQGYLLTFHKDAPATFKKIQYNQINQQYGGALDRASQQGLIGVADLYQGVP